MAVVVIGAGAAAAVWVASDSPKNDAPRAADSSAAPSVEWTDVEAGRGREPTIAIDASVYPDAEGVQFFLNGEVDDRNPAERPNGYDATGTSAGSSFHMWPPLDLSSGDVVGARWLDSAGQEHSAEVVIAGPASSKALSTRVDAAADESSNQRAVRGPTGQWPGGFPGYDSPAEVVTTGTNAGLAEALVSPACADGCVIEHPGDLNDYGDLTRVPGGEIVIRPPLGQRADYRIDGSLFLRGDNVLVAGFEHIRGELNVSEGRNSGFAWIEGSGLEGGLSVFALGTTAEGFFYEIVQREYAAAGMGDRGGLRAAEGGDAVMRVVGSILTGSVDPAPEFHADTLQLFYTDDSSGRLEVGDSVIWPSWDKAIQGIDSNGGVVLDNVWIASPAYANALRFGLDLGGFSAITSVATVTNSTLVGGVNAEFPVTVGASELYDVDGIVDAGNNTVVEELPLPGPVPTHRQLDGIWHE